MSLNLAETQNTEPFGIYIHWPFCAAKCPYCDFNSHVRRNPIDEPRFAAALAREMGTVRARTGPRRVTSVFIGGGTPSLMLPRTIAAVLDKIAALWQMADDAEITMEANPSSVEADRFKGYRAAGVNRLSLGVQALNDAELRRLGRIHNVEQALYAIGLAREIFPRLSFDLIYARPDQTAQAWRQELNRAIDLAADHLSLYQLTIEEGTLFRKLYEAGRLVLPSDKVAAELYAITQEVTAARGLPAYEISNHAAPGCESRHNLLYWRGQDYAGIGAGAHGRFYEYQEAGSAAGATGNDKEEAGRNGVPTGSKNNAAKRSDSPDREANDLAGSAAGATETKNINAAGQNPAAVSATQEHAIRAVTMTEKLPERWLELVETTGTGIIEEERLTPAEQADELLLMGLRLYEGLDIARYEALAGRPLSSEKLFDLQEAGLVEMRGNSRLRATAEGRIVLNSVIAALAA